MDVEYDPQKSESNKIKHGIDFEEALELWDDEDYLEAELDREGERRFIVIGKIGKRYWSAICTTRQQITRIISVRRARKNEVAMYEENR